MLPRPTLSNHSAASTFSESPLLSRFRSRVSQTSLPIFPFSFFSSILTMTKRGSIIMYFPTDKQQFETQPHSVTYSPDNGHTVGKSTLVMNIASLLEWPKPKPKSRMELKWFFELRIKKRVKELPANDKFRDLMTSWKKKVELFTLQKVEAWNYRTVRIGKKWLGHGLKKVKESEIKHLADSSFLLNRIYNTNNANHIEITLNSKPPNNGFMIFIFIQYSCFSFLTVRLKIILKFLIKTEIVAPINAIKMGLLWYGLTTRGTHGLLIY